MVSANSTIPVTTSFHCEPADPPPSAHDPTASQAASNRFSKRKARTTSAVLTAATVTMTAPTSRLLLAAIAVPPNTAGANMSQIPTGTPNASVTGSVTPHALAGIWLASGEP